MAQVIGRRKRPAGRAEGAQGAALAGPDNNPELVLAASEVKEEGRGGRGRSRPEKRSVKKEEKEDGSKKEEKDGGKGRQRRKEEEARRRGRRKKQKGMRERRGKEEEGDEQKERNMKRSRK